MGLPVRVAHLWEKRHTPEARQLFKYTLVSVISTGVSFASLAVIFGVLRLWGQEVSTVVSNCIAAIPSYYLNRKWVWGKGGRSHLTKEVLPFWVMAVFGITVSLGGATIAHRLSVEHHLGHLEATVVVLAANVLSFAIFWVLKFLLYNRLFRVHPLEELDELVEAA